MDWPFRRLFRRHADERVPDSTAGDAASVQSLAAGDGEGSPAWSTLAPLQRSFEPIPMTAPSRAFSRAVAESVAMPIALAPLGHERSADGPNGLVTGLASPVIARSPQPGLARAGGPGAHAELRFAPSARVQRQAADAAVGSKAWTGSVPPEGWGPVAVPGAGAGRTVSEAAADGGGLPAPPSLSNASPEPAAIPDIASPSRAVTVLDRPAPVQRSLVSAADLTGIAFESHAGRSGSLSPSSTNADNSSRPGFAAGVDPRPAPGVQRTVDTIGDPAQAGLDRPARLTVGQARRLGLGAPFASGGSAAHTTVARSMTDASDPGTSDHPPAAASLESVSGGTPSAGSGGPDAPLQRDPDGSPAAPSEGSPRAGGPAVSGSGEPDARDWPWSTETSEERDLAPLSRIASDASTVKAPAPVSARTMMGTGADDASSAAGPPSRRRGSAEAPGLDAPSVAGSQPEHAAPAITTVSRLSSAETRPLAGRDMRVGLGAPIAGRLPRGPESGSREALPLPPQSTPLSMSRAVGPEEPAGGEFAGPDAFGLTPAGDPPGIERFSQGPEDAADVPAVARMTASMPDIVSPPARADIAAAGIAPRQGGDPAGGEARDLRFSTPSQPVQRSAVQRFAVHSRPIAPLTGNAPLGSTNAANRAPSRTESAAQGTGLQRLRGADPFGSTDITGAASTADPWLALSPARPGPADAYVGAARGGSSAVRTLGVGGAPALVSAIQREPLPAAYASGFDTRSPLAGRGSSEPSPDHEAADLAMPPPIVARMPADPGIALPESAAWEPVAQRADAAAPASGGGAGATSIPSGDKELDDLARLLYDRIRSRLRLELLVDRERSGLLSDVG